MSDFDFNYAEPQRAMGDLIPENTIVLLVASVRPGQHGPGGWLKLANSGAEMLDMEFTIDGGDYDRRKVWENWVTSGETDGQQKAAGITRSRIRAVLESVHGIDPGDDSETAMAARRLAGWGGLDGLKFCAKLGIEQGGLKDKMAGPQSERYADKNKIKAILTPSDAEYISPGPNQTGMQTAGKALKSAVAGAGAATQAAVGGAKPSWAK
jgi:hypothetical protein